MKKRSIPIKPKSEYVETESGNRISRKSQLHATAYIVLGGKTIIEHGVELRGDCHRKDSKSPVIALGKFCILNENCSITPPHKKSSSTGEDTYYPVKIGSYVQIGKNTKLTCASIGNNVYIGNNCTIGEFTIIKDCVVIKDDTVIPPYTVIAPMSIVSGNSPSKVITNQLPESAEQVLELNARQTYTGISIQLPFIN